MIYLILSFLKNEQMILSACGLKCDECEYFNKTCAGCHKVAGSTFWAKEMMPSGVCPLYDCSVRKKGYRDCGDCAELPCGLFVQMKDPNSTEEEHLKALGARGSLLKTGK